MTRLNVSSTPHLPNRWPVALRFYAKAALLQSAVVWVIALILPPVLWALHGFPVDAIRGTLTVMAIGLGIGVPVLPGHAWDHHRI